MKYKKHIALNFNNNLYRILKSNHLFEVRTKNKQRDQYISDSTYKDIIKISLINGLTSFRNKKEVAITIGNSNKKNHSCTCILVALDNYNNITIITAIQTYGNKKWQRGFTKVKNRINIVPSCYFIPRVTDEELEYKKKEKIFNYKDKALYSEDKLFLKYAEKNNLKK